MLQGHRDLRVFQLAYQLAMDIFEESKKFPKEERYSLTDQVRRSSRSVAANIAEGFRKRRYPAAFVSKLTDSDAECAETQVHLAFARDCGYSTEEFVQRICESYEQVGRMLGKMMSKPESFMPQ